MKTDAYRRAESAELILACCAAVYLNPNGPGFLNFCAQRGLRYSMIERGNAAACVFSSDQQIIAVVRGTDDVDDWKQNLKSRRLKKYIGSGKVGSGFGAHFGLIRRPLLEAIQSEFGRAPRPILLGGHSLGATSAVYLAHELHERLIPFDLLAIAGSPRPGDKEFSAHMDTILNGRLIQLRRKGDIVPTVPPHLFGHRHLKSHLAYIDIAGKFRRNLAPIWQVANRVVSIASAHVGPGGFKIGRCVVKEDHSAAAYAADVRRTLDSTRVKATAWAGVD